MKSSWAISSPKRWCCESAALNMPANLENSPVDTGLEKAVFTLIPTKGNAKECSNYCTIALISHASKMMLKILQCSKCFNSSWTENFQMFKLDLEKAEEPEVKLKTYVESSKKQESSRKISTSALLTIPKLLAVWITKNMENSQRDGNTRPPDLPPEKSVCRSRSNS